MSCNWLVSVVADVCEVFCESGVESAASFPHILNGASGTVQEVDEVRGLAIKVF